jgi:hypothetical protein
MIVRLIAFFGSLPFGQLPGWLPFWLITDHGLWIWKIFWLFAKVDQLFLLGNFANGTEMNERVAENWSIEWSSQRQHDNKIRCIYLWGGEKSSKRMAMRSNCKGTSTKVREPKRIMRVAEGRGENSKMLILIFSPARMCGWAQSVIQGQTHHFYYIILRISCTDKTVLSTVMTCSQFGESHIV